MDHMEIGTKNSKTRTATDGNPFRGFFFGALQRHHELETAVARVRLAILGADAAADDQTQLVTELDPAKGEPGLPALVVAPTLHDGFRAEM